MLQASPLVITDDFITKNSSGSSTKSLLNMIHTIDRRLNDTVLVPPGLIHEWDPMNELCIYEDKDRLLAFVSKYVIQYSSPNIIKMVAADTRRDRHHYGSQVDLFQQLSVYRIDGPASFT